MELRAEPYNRKVHGLWRRPRRTLGLPGSITEYILAKNLSSLRSMNCLKCRSIPAARWPSGNARSARRIAGTRCESSLKMPAMLCPPARPKAILPWSSPCRERCSSGSLATWQEPVAREQRLSSVRLSVLLSVLVSGAGGFWLKMQVFALNGKDGFQPFAEMASAAFGRSSLKRLGV